MMMWHSTHDDLTCVVNKSESAYSQALVPDPGGHAPPRAPLHTVTPPEAVASDDGGWVILRARSYGRGNGDDAAQHSEKSAA